MINVTVGRKAKTLNGNVVKIVGGAILNYCDTGVIEANDRDVILVQCENESGDTEYWLAHQLSGVEEE